MTVPVPAGAGGVDREAIAKRRTEAMSALLSVARVLPDLLVSGCVRTSRRHAVDALHASLLDVRALLAALAAAEQRADTLAAEIRELERAHLDAIRRDGEVVYDPPAALSSRPVQPDTERSGT